MARKNWNFFHFKIINDTWNLPHGKYANKDIKRAIIREFTVFTVQYMYHVIGFMHWYLTALKRSRKQNIKFMVIHMSIPFLFLFW